MDLTVVVPYVQEWPQNFFTVAQIAEELKDEGFDFEIITVDNYMDNSKYVHGSRKYREEDSAQHRKHDGPDRARDNFDACQKGNDWLKSIEYSGKLSHWQAKNEALKVAKADIYWFCDSHCIVSKGVLVRMFKYYKEHWQELNGSLHLPLTYTILEWRRLIYKLVNEIKTGVVHYSFTPFRTQREDYYKPYEVPAMSTCGMMIHREYMDLLGNWPTELGIYGGGENFINFGLAVLGKTKNIWPDEPLRHHGDKRGYEYAYDDYHRNRMIATYMFGGRDLMYLYARNCKGSKAMLYTIAKDVEETCSIHRQHIKGSQLLSIQEWLEKQQE